MPAAPPDELVRQLLDIGLGMTWHDAAKNNNLDAAVAAFLDGEDITKVEAATQWDESVWGGDRDTGANSDRHLRPLTGSAAQSRPSSPAPSVSARSNLAPTNEQEADADLQRALEMSQGELGGAFQQETGVIGAAGQESKHFGPATRENYEEDRWAMVSVGPNNTSEIIPDTDIEDRRHVLAEPRLLKYLPSGDYTPNFLTICQAINGAKEALLMRDFLHQSYGQDPDWWRGHPIPMPRIVTIDHDNAARPDANKSDDLLAEVQRVMAFLTASDRSYASIDALTQVDPLRNHSPSMTRSRTFLELFIQSWTSAVASKSIYGDTASRVFTTTVGTDSEDGLDTTDMYMIDLPVHFPEGKNGDLSEELDALLWNPSDEDDMTDDFIERPAEVLVMRIHQRQGQVAGQLRIDVPPILHVDKYLRQNISATRALRKEIASRRRRIEKIQLIEDKLQKWRHPTLGVQLDASTLLQHTIGHFSSEIQRASDPSYLPNGVSTSEDLEAAPAPHRDMTKKLEDVMANIEKKLSILAEEKEKTRKAISELSKAPPAGMKSEDLQHRYTLRGVATKPNITYVLSVTDPDLEMEEDTLEDDNTPHGMRWWRMEYEVSTNGYSAKITKTKTPDYDVLRAVELEHHSALLVYASDYANDTSHEDHTLPGPLNDFIIKDNELFAADLQRERNKPPSYDLVDIEVPLESIERTSLDSTRVEARSDSGHPSPPAYGEDAFMDHPDFGLGPGIKEGYRREEDDGPVHEIKLDSPEIESMEMTEKANSALIPELATENLVADTKMEDASQGSSYGADSHTKDMAGMK